MVLLLNERLPFYNNRGLYSCIGLQYFSLLFYTDADSHHLVADPDPVLHFVADPDPSLHSAHFSISHNRKKQFRIKNLIVFVCTILYS